ncbi:MAG: response regulator transcription factor, partial [Actinomycetota bacterium]|nr:response regulator transcription factor [Actinomycetota bacterium]
VDLDLPHASGVDALVEIRRQSPTTACLVLTALTDDVEMGRSVEAGAAAVVHKSIDVAHLLEAVRAVAGGASLLSAPETSRWLQALAAAREQLWHAQALNDSLSPREAEVLEQLSRGHSSQDIARTLGIAPDTVQTHIRNLLAKLGVGSRLEAVAKALRLGLVPPPR